MLKKIPLANINGTKNAHCRFHFVFIKSLYFCSTKVMDSLTLRHNSFQNESNRKATHSFASRQIF